MIPVGAPETALPITADSFAQTVEAIAERERPLQLLKYFLRHPAEVDSHVDLCARSFQRIPKEAFQRTEVLVKTQEVFGRLPEFAKASCDTRIQAGQGSLSLHRNLVAAQCSILEEKLRDEDTEWADFPLLLSDVSPMAIQHVIDILEFGVTNFTTPQAVLETLRQGATWGLDAVSVICERLLIKLLAPSNALAMWQFAFATGRPYLLLKVGEFIRSRLTLTDQVNWTSSGNVAAMICAREYLGLVSRGVLFSPSQEEGIRVQFRFRIPDTTRRTLWFLGKIGAKRVNLSHNGLTVEHLAILAQEALRLPSFDEVDLSHNPVGSKGVYPLSALLRGGGRLKGLRLASCDIGCSGVGPLGEALRRNHGLKFLDLSGNRISRSGAKSLGAMLMENSGLEKLFLNRNPLGQSGLKHLLQGAAKHPSLKQLYLNGTGLGSGAHPALADFVKNSRSIDTLDLSYCDLTDSALKSLSENLRRSPSLRTLKLKGNNFTQQGVAALSRALTPSPPLTYLDLSDNCIGNPGLDAISQALKTNNRLEVLKLAGLNPLEGGKIRSSTAALGEGLRQNKTLRVLDLSLSKPYMEGLVEVLNGLRENNTLEALMLFDSNLQQTERVPEEAAEGKRYVREMLHTVSEVLNSLKAGGGTQVWW